MAVVGVSIASITLTVGLLRANVPITLYESTRASNEIGTGLNFGINVTRAIVLISPDVMAGFEIVATFNQWDSKKQTWFDIRRGMRNGGAHIDTDEAELIYLMLKGQAAVHSAQSLQAGTQQSG